MGFPSSVVLHYSTTVLYFLHSSVLDSTLISTHSLVQPVEAFIWWCDVAGYIIGVTTYTMTIIHVITSGNESS